MAERGLDDRQLEQLQALCEQATPAPWSYAEDDSSGVWRILGPEGQRLFEEPSSDSDEDTGVFEGSSADYRLVAAARAALPRLLGELRVLRRAVSQARVALDAARPDRPA
jgi:hypothetical protein